MKMLPAGSQATSVGWRKRPSSCTGGDPPRLCGTASSEASCLRPNTIKTRPSGLNLTIMSDPFVHGPNVVFLVDAHGVPVRKGVEVLADLTKKLAVGTKLQQLRSRRPERGTGRVAARQ